MFDSHYSEAVRALCNEYYNRNISMVEYRLQRQKLIDQMDADANGLALEYSTNEDITRRKYTSNDE